MPDKLFGQADAASRPTDYTVVFSRVRTCARARTMQPRVRRPRSADPDCAAGNFGRWQSRNAERTAADTRPSAKRRLRRGRGQRGGRGRPAGHDHPEGAARAGRRPAGHAGCASHASRRVALPGGHATEVTFPFQPGDYVVHAAHGIAYFQRSGAPRRGRHRARLPAAGVRRGRQAVRAGGAARPRDPLRGAGGREPPPYAPEHEPTGLGP